MLKGSCKGCNEYKDSCRILSQFSYKGIMRHCPCQTCLIKGICNRDCDRYADYVNMYYDTEDTDRDEAINQTHLTIKYANQLEPVCSGVHHYHKSIPVLINYNKEMCKWTLTPMIEGS